MTDTEKHAHLLVGARMDQVRGPAVGVAFFPDPPNGKVVREMGFTRVETTERVGVDPEAVKSGGASVPPEPTLFFFARGPDPRSTFVATLNPDGSFKNVKVEPRHPYRVIPKLVGTQAARLIPIPQPTGQKEDTGPDTIDVKKLGRSGPQSTPTTTSGRRETHRS